MDRRTFLKSAAASAFGQSPAGKPNFVVILADDMGYSDAGCFGGDVDTPNLDKLAAKGLRFTNAYSTARCGPSRNCLLTGYYAQQNAADVMTPGNVPAWTKFLPEYLKPYGYRSYHSGKWHIRFKPLTGTGFDGSYTLLDENRYFGPRVQQLNEQPLAGSENDDTFYITTEIAGRAIAFLQRHASQDQDKPFFLYLAFTSPHFPLHALQQDIELYADRFWDGWDASRARRLERMHRMKIVNCDLSPLEPNIRPPWNTPDGELFAKIGLGEVTRAIPWTTLSPEQKKLQRTKMAIHAAMITRMDREIGRLLDQLRLMNQLENTVILFLSDNGASAEQIIRGDGHDPSAPPGSGKSYLCLGPGWASAANTPFRLHKSYVHEGGIASPFVVHWPAGIRDKGGLRHDPCHFIDVLPTLVGLAGGNVHSSLGKSTPELPGQSLVPALAKGGTVSRDYLYFNHSNNRAIRVDKWKMIATGQDGPWELYDLSRDRGEQRNLISRRPDLARKLSQLWEDRDTEFIRVREAAPASTRPRLAR